MAEGTSVRVEIGEEQDKECAVCLQPYVHPAQLPCGHVFCFLCIKGTANQSKRCAMCRQEIPRDFIEKPNLLRGKLADIDEKFEGCYQWFYEGRNGWWQYDERTSKELEFAYKSGERTCELLIAGFLYVMDFEAMLQLRRNDPSRRRRIKRDLASIDKKGVAGLRGEKSSETMQNPPVIATIDITSDDEDTSTTIDLRDNLNMEGVPNLNHPQNSCGVTREDVTASNDEAISDHVNLEGWIGQLNLTSN